MRMHLTAAVTLVLLAMPLSAFAQDPPAEQPPQAPVAPAAPAPGGPNGSIARCVNGDVVYVDTGAQTCSTAGGVKEWFGKGTPQQPEEQASAAAGAVTELMGENGNEVDAKLNEATEVCQGEAGMMPTGALSKDIGSPEVTTLQFMSLVQKFTYRSGCSRMMAAWALDLKSEALALEETNRALALGAADKDAIEKSKQKSSALATAVDDGLKDGSKELKKASRGPLLAAIVYTAITAKAATDLVIASKDYVQFTADVLKNAGMLQKVRMALSLKSSISYAQGALGAIASTISSLKSLVAYARANDLDVPSDALSALEGQ